MKTRTTIIIILILTAAMLITSAALSSRFSGNLVTHWGDNGQPDGYSSRTTALYLLPLMLGVIPTFVLLLPYIDPLRRNVDLFRPQYNLFVLLLTVFLAYVHILSLIWNLNGNFNMETYLLPGVGLLFFFVGDMLKLAKRNWFIGIRNPWTMSSDFVWDKTHQRGSVLFKISALFCVAAVFLPDVGFFLIMVPVLLSAAYLMIYSYVLYAREQRQLRSKA